MVADAPPPTPPPRGISLALAGGIIAPLLRLAWFVLVQARFEQQLGVAKAAELRAALLAVAEDTALAWTPSRRREVPSGSL